MVAVACAAAGPVTRMAATGPTLRARLLGLRSALHRGRCDGGRFVLLPLPLLLLLHHCLMARLLLLLLLLSLLAL